MQPEERQHRIAEHLQKVEFASLEEIAGQVDASVSTVRRDLSILEAGGNCQRTHGGARVIVPRSDEFTFTARDTHQLAEKEAIGRACAELIAPNQSVIIDAGTTVYHVARYLESKSPQIITNSLPVANLFASANRLEVVVSGGVIYPRLGGARRSVRGGSILPHACGRCGDECRRHHRGRADQFARTAD